MRDSIRRPGVWCCCRSPSYSPGSLHHIQPGRKLNSDRWKSDRPRTESKRSVMRRENKLPAPRFPPHIRCGEVNCIQCSERRGHRLRSPVEYCACQLYQLECLDNPINGCTANSRHLSGQLPAQMQSVKSSKTFDLNQPAGDACGDSLPLRQLPWLTQYDA